MKLFRKILISAAILACGAASATANTITPSFVSVVDQLDGTFLWTYSASLSNGRLDDDDFAADQFFTIYDIYGYQAGSASASSGDWTASSSLVGPTGAGQAALVVDAPALANVSFQYTSTTTICSGSSPAGCIPGLPIFLGFFSFESTFGAIVEGDWSSQDVARLSTSAQGANGNIEVPSIPDGGSTMAFLGLAMLAVGTLRNRLRG